MLKAKSIKSIETGLPGVEGFRITGQIDKADLSDMAQHMLSAFEDREQVDMLIVFETDDTTETGAGFSGDAMKAQFKALTNVRNYVVANAPGKAGDLVEAMGRLMPVEARSFDTETAAIDWLEQQPAPLK